jgi:O-antigen/teichoic acid export membrane protein
MKSEGYKSIFKTTAIFGGTQVFNILINIVRSKFIAVFLGPVGIGINAMLTSTTGVIASLTNFGLATSAVKNIAEAKATGNQQRIGEVVTVFRSWVWITGLLGFIVALLTAPLLSKLTFGNNQYTWSFALISITLLLTQISAGQGVVLRGMRQIKYMAQSSLLGSLIGLFTAVPLYYFFKNDGIVPAIILSSVTALLLTSYYARKVKINKVKVDKSMLFAEGKEMLRMGFMLSLSGLITLGANYILRIFISRKGSVADVGLYNAGFTMINTYVGLIFTALSTDYYPRLSSVVHDKLKTAKEINQQAETSLLILAPIICFFLTFSGWVVVLLYSDKFIAISSMVHWLALGMFLKASSWAVAFLILAKGDSKVFFWNELFTNAYLLLFNFIGYHFWGLTGLGISFFCAYLVYLIQIIVLANMRYGFSFNRNFLSIFFTQAVLALLCFLSVIYLDGFWAYLFGFLFLGITIIYSCYEINKRIGIKQIIRSFKARFSGKKESRISKNESGEEVQND